jgi:lactoylglutathione lyase
MSNSLFHKLDCVRLFVDDIDSALSFYRDKLGHDLIWRTPQAAGLRMPGTDAEIVLQTERQGIEVDFLVSSADTAALEFEQAGGSILVPPFDIQIGRCAVVKDPWGNELVLLDMSKGRLVTDAQGYVIGNS